MKRKPKEKTSYAPHLASQCVGSANNYLTAVCELVAYAKDGDTQRRKDQLLDALNAQSLAYELFRIVSGVTK